jgi:hypothetical protein
MMERQRPQSKVSLEDLLRLKRAERPAPEFWAEFEDQLRRKQLAAIVDKRPWWRRLSVANLAKLSIPVGTTAVIAFTLVTVRERSQPAAETQQVAAVTTSAPLAATDMSATQSPVSSADADRSMSAALDHSPAPVAQQDVSHDAAIASTPASGNASPENSPAVITSRERAEPSLAQVILGLEGTMESDARPDYQSDAALPLLASLSGMDGASAYVTPASGSGALNQLSSPRDDRRARLLASVDNQDRSDLISGNSRVTRSRERIANRLAEQSLYDSISRLGLNADSVSIKF